MWGWYDNAKKYVGDTVKSWTGNGVPDVSKDNQQQPGTGNVSQGPSEKPRAQESSHQVQQPSATNRARSATVGGGQPVDISQYKPNHYSTDYLDETMKNLSRPLYEALSRELMNEKSAVKKLSSHYKVDNSRKQQQLAADLYLFFVNEKKIKDLPSMQWLLTDIGMWRGFEQYMTQHANSSQPTGHQATASQQSYGQSSSTAVGTQGMGGVQRQGATAYTSTSSTQGSMVFQFKGKQVDLNQYIPICYKDKKLTITLKELSSPVDRLLKQVGNPEAVPEGVHMHVNIYYADIIADRSGRRREQLAGDLYLFLVKRKGMPPLNAPQDKINEILNDPKVWQEFEQYRSKF